MRVLIDFNAETSDGRFSALKSRLESPVSLGELIQAHDEDGNQLLVTVEEFDEERGLVYLQPDWSSWIDEDSDSTVVYGAWAQTGTYLRALIDFGSTAGLKIGLNEAMRTSDLCFGPLDMSFTRLPALA
jgi:hypothetical protein